MWYINLSGGVSHTALYKALLLVIEDKKQQFSDLLYGYVRKNKTLSEIVYNKDKSNLNPLLINKRLKKIPPVGKKEAKELAGDLSSILDTILSLSGEKSVTAFNLLIYLSLLILMEKLNIKEQVKILPPGIGTDSPENVFQLLKGITIILDPLIPPAATLCSAFCKYYADLFIHQASGILFSFVKFSDPFNKNIRGWLFRCDDWKGMTDGYDHDVIGVLETNIDDCTPEVISGAMVKILGSGALDYTITPVIMKKGRSGFHIQVLCRENDLEKIAEELLSQTSSFGLRMYTSLRKKLQRKIEKIQTVYGEVRVKIGYKENKIVKAVPEFDDLKRISETRGIPLFELYNEIMVEVKKGIDCFVKDDKITLL